MLRLKISEKKNDITFKKSALIVLQTVIVHTVRAQLLKEILSSEWNQSWDAPEQTDK